MKKIFTLLAAAVMTGSISAETVILANPDKLKQNVLSGTDLGADVPEGFSLQCMNETKNLESGNEFTIEGTKYRSIKFSNGAQNTVTLPEGYVATKVTFYTTINKDAATDRPCYWAEVAGTEYTVDDNKGIIESFKDYDNPNVQTFSVPNLNVFTFKNTGEQPFAVIEITYEEGSEAPAPAEGETMTVFGNGSGIFNKQFDSYVTPFEYNAADRQLTLNNFLGGKTDVVLDFKPRNGESNEVGTCYDAFAVSGLGESELIDGFYQMCPINDFDGNFILKQDGTNIGMLENIKIALGGATYYMIKKDSADDPGYLQFTIFFGGNYYKWNTETSSWDASGMNYVRFEYKLPLSALSSIDSIAADFDENAPVEYYNLQGVRVNNPANGIFIKRQGNKVEKVLVK